MSLVTAALRQCAKTWWSYAALVSGLATTLAAFIVVVVGLSLSVGLAILVPLGAGILVITFLCSDGFARLERSRIRSLQGVRIERHVQPLTGGAWAKFVQLVKSRARWAEIGYHVVAMPWATLAFAATTALWSVCLSAIALPFYLDSLPGPYLKVLGWKIYGRDSAWELAAIGLLVALTIAPMLTNWMAGRSVWIAQKLLGASESSKLAQRVEELDARRAAAVQTADAERRRIERDLHDGAQQRLLAIAMELGEARNDLAHSPERAAERLEHAHNETKAAIKELRDLVRGFHPAIIEDRGLNAALSSVIARCPVPITLDYQVNERPRPEIESAAYFIICEAVTNVARHSNATDATVHVVRLGDRLIIEVSDNGTGGADPAAGTGLTGLQGRVEALDGWFQLMSPVGGPTTIVASLACGAPPAGETPTSDTGTSDMGTSAPPTSETGAGETGNYAAGAPT